MADTPSNRALDALMTLTGSTTAAERLLDAAYSELRRLAGAYVAKLPPGQTVQATDLLHEAWLRISARQGLASKDRGQFIAAVAQVMRDVLVDEARRKGAEKRGGGRNRLTLSATAPEVNAAPSGLLDIHEALERLERDDPRAAKLVLLRYFGGLTEKETSDVLGVTERTVQREWAYCRAWLKRELARTP